MGNCFRRCFEEDSDSGYVGHGYGGQRTGGAGPIVYSVVGFTAVARDLFEFETTNKVPGSLVNYVSASKATQRIWYEKLLAAWKRANPAPASAEAVALLVIQTLQGHHGIEGLLSFYHLPWPTVPVHQPLPEVTKPGGTTPAASGTWVVEPADAEHIQFEIQTLPVKWNENEGDGDGLTVLADVGKGAREAKSAHKYKIRLRGVDAPEIGQPYGDEARDILRDLVKDQRLVIHVYNIDKYKRAVGDVYCRGIFIQEELLKKGSVWHYVFHDKREKFAQLERAAKAARLGLWAHPNPEAPWDWRRRHRRLDSRNGRSFGKNRGA